METKRFDLGDPYHLAITMSWGAFFASCLAIDLVVNFDFALLYMLQPHAVVNVAPGSLSDAFFFSVETLATVGYGVMAPASTYCHIVASCELTCGLAFIALVTGLIFVRFSRIKAKVAFADKVVIARHDGHPTLMIYVPPKLSMTIGTGSRHGITLAKTRTINREPLCSSHTLVHSERCHSSDRDGKSRSACFGTLCAAPSRPISIRSPSNRNAAS